MNTATLNGLAGASENAVYVPWKPRAEATKLVLAANEILSEYEDSGYEISIRTLYYQFVSRNLLPNNETAYKNLCSLVSSARLAGMIPWSSVSDRTRQFTKNNHWGTPKEILEACAEGFAIDKWATQRNYVEVWVEKEALLGVVGKTCEELDIPYMACKGFPSTTAIYAAALRFMKADEAHKAGVLLYLGDFDSSGLEIPRSIKKSLDCIHDYHDVRRVDMLKLGLNLEQVEKYNLPPNPAKQSDTRARSFISAYGSNSYELDALPPAVISNLIEEAVLELRDQTRWDESIKREQKHIAQLQENAKNFAA